MTISTLSNDAPLSSIEEEDNLSRSNLEMNPLAAVLAAYARAPAAALVTYADVGRTRPVKKLGCAPRILTQKDHPAARPCLLYFGG
jgi:hypothetical protein